ncbi:hypothetical protein DFH08DRAFT_918916 [Mycena albidolilacea]|uniref:CxC2-like cysteine cluster KDZ transposase-associated domain-containing protein n=1 Tax=Mycena albidolilacea TaxID=1033008 RepID=A0AAD7E8T5_9AGAR|nr:hypothetical protein DFH08DRAFT_918916 [Mycena albidolilacea]
MPNNPQSAITIAALKLFHAVSLQGKTTVYRFSNALEKLMDNTGRKAFKGELAVDCITCPKAGVNLPEGWENAPVEFRYLYTIFLAIDACFRLKRKRISNGWVYFVRSFTYEDFVKTLGEQKEMSTCTGLAALDHANTKYSQGYAAMGCGMVTCGRHEIVYKKGVRDLQAGEKYGNMDYIVASAWRHLRDLLFFLLSYDVMCQWSKSLRERLLKLPPALRFQLAHYFVKFVIPKLHILGHLKFCQDFFSLLYILGSAQADIEGIERIWSLSGLMGASTREMGTTLWKRLLQARKELVRQKDALQEFTLAQEGEVTAWKQVVNDFETGVLVANPYQLPHAGPTLKDVKLELMREDQEHEQASAAVPEAADETMTEYLMLGLEIEGQQCQLAADLQANRSPTTKELTDFVMRCTQVSRQIKKLRLMQRKYSPGALQCLAMAVDPVDPAEAERAPLFLPSSLSPLQSAPPLSVPGLVAEARLRDGQCSESLEIFRHGLVVKRWLQTYKNLNSR